jgi:hypothetical protein
MRYQIASLVVHYLSFLKFYIFMKGQKLSQSGSNVRRSNQYVNRGQLGSRYQSSNLTSIDKDGMDSEFESHTSRIPDTVIMAGTSPTWATRCLSAS